MADKSKIEWTDATWNPVTGCSVVSPGCTNCYAMKLAGTRLRHHPSRKGLTAESKAGPVWNGEVRFNRYWLEEPLRWQRPRRIFVCAHGDLFHEAVPADWIDRVFAVMALARQHTYQVLTKRPARMRAYLADADAEGRIIDTALMMRELPHQWEWPLPHVWLGVSAEDQARAEERIPELLATPAAVRFVSAEPLLGPVDLTGYLWGRAEPCADCPRDADCDCGGLPRHMLGSEPDLAWVIVGGESGRDARPMHPDWARSLRDQCQEAGVAFHFKQWGEWGPGAEFEAQGSARAVYRGEIQTLVGLARGEIKLCIPTRDDDSLGPPLTLERYGKKIAGRTLDGRTWDEVPG